MPLRILAMFFLGLSLKPSYGAEFSIDGHEFYSRYNANKINRDAVKRGYVVRQPVYEQELRYLLATSGSFFENLSFLLKPKLKILKTDLKYQSLVRIDEGYLTLVLADEIYIDLGRKDIRWGKAYSYSLVNGFDMANRFTTFDNEYRDSLSLQYFLGESLSLTAVLLEEGKQFALRLNHAVGEFDYDIYAFDFEDPSIGASIAHALTSSLELHGEVIGQWGSKRPYPIYKGRNVFLYEDLKDETSIMYGKFVIGGQYTTKSQYNFLFEYFHDETGYDNQEKVLMDAGIEESIRNEKYNDEGPFRMFFFDYHTNYDFAEFRQNYYFVRVSKEDFFIDGLDIQMPLFYSVDESSYVFIPDTIYQVTSHVALEGKLFLPGPGVDSEFNHFFNHYGSLGIRAKF